MNKIALFLTIFVMSSNWCMADVWVVHKDGDIYSVSEQNDAVIPSGYSAEVLSGTIADLALSRPIDEYKFTGKKFKVNADKIREKEDIQLDAERKATDKLNKKKSAKDKLKSLGLSDDEIDALVGGK